MKKILIILAVLFFLFSGLVGVLSIPFVTYWAILNQKHNFEFFKLEHPEKMSKLLAGAENPRLMGKEGDSAFEEKYWKPFHVANYQIPLPLYHPLFSITPVINEEDYRDYLELGIRFHTQTQKVLAELFFNESAKFEKHMGSQKIFTLPLVKSYLEKKETPAIWRDLFKKDLTKVSFWDVLHITPEEMVYNLYLIHLRAKFFPPHMVRPLYLDKLQMGGMEVKWEGNELTKEVWVVLVDGLLESYTLTYRADHAQGRIIRGRLVGNTMYFPSFVDKTRALYEEFRDLPYQNKIAQEGMIFLFAAWSHNTHDKEFLREIIGHLERGEGNLAQLQPLYIYAFKHYGDQFSGQRGKDDKIKELEQKIKDEEAKQIKDEKKAAVETGQVDFENKEERMKYFLQKAKERKKRKPSNTLIFD